ncbi:uncharacterized protein [Manis javanica]|uniref:uncharacterized protein n=1 Tax=Manis javanica TaxID=9974 RepID=UPI003C6CFD66
MRAWPQAPERRNVPSASLDRGPSAPVRVPIPEAYVVAFLVCPRVDVPSPRAAGVTRGFSCHRPQPADPRGRSPQGSWDSDGGGGGSRAFLRKELSPAPGCWTKACGGYFLLRLVGEVLSGDLGLGDPGEFAGIFVCVLDGHLPISFLPASVCLKFLIVLPTGPPTRRAQCLLTIFQTLRRESSQFEHGRQKGKISCFLHLRDRFHAQSLGPTRSGPKVSETQNLNQTLPLPSPAGHHLRGVHLSTTLSAPPNSPAGRASRT